MLYYNVVVYSICSIIMHFMNTWFPSACQSSHDTGALCWQAIDLAYTSYTLASCSKYIHVNRQWWRRAVTTIHAVGFHRVIGACVTVCRTQLHMSSPWHHCLEYFLSDCVILTRDEGKEVRAGILWIYHLWCQQLCNLFSFGWILEVHENDTCDVCGEGRGA